MAFWQFLKWWKNKIKRLSYALMAVVSSAIVRRSPGALRSDINSRWPSRHLTKPPLRARTLRLADIWRCRIIPTSEQAEITVRTTAGWREKPSFHVMYQAHTSHPLLMKYLLSVGREFSPFSVPSRPHLHSAWARTVPYCLGQLRRVSGGREGGGL